MNKIVFTCDIEKMYRQIKVKNEQQDYQRFVWRSSEDELLQEYRMTRVPFGLTSAPYLAIKTLKKVAENQKDRYPLGSKILETECYVDDILTGGETMEEVLKKKEELIEILRAPGFELRKWASNDTQVLTDVHENDRVKN